ncbi:MAG TPA: glycosyltransferase family 39 protein, partial [Nitrolancea sp.]|nr:glycosyltransferase family 39 protein [Nitrolancea sp.]
MHQSAETFDGHLGEVDIPSLLDRPLSLASLSWLSVGWVAVAFVAFLIRVVNYSSLPLSFNEARIASEALNVVQGGTITATASSAPLPTALTALALFLFGTSDGIVRLIPLIAGLGTLGLIWWLRRWIGQGPALTAAALVAISPTFVQSSRNASDGGLLVFGSLLTLIAGLAWFERRSSGYALLCGVGAAMMVMADPIGWVALPIVAAVIAFLAEELDVSLRDVPIMVLGAAVTIVLVSTNLFTHPTGLPNFFRESFRSLWDQHLQNAGSEWHLAFFQLTIDETVALGLAVLAVIFMLRKRSIAPLNQMVVPGLLLWTVLGLLAGSILGGKNVPLYTLTVLPLVLLAGVGLDELIARVYWPDVVTSRGLLFLLAVPITFFAGVSTYGLLSSDVGTDAFAWIFTFVLVAVVIFAPLLALTIWIGRSMSVQAWALIGLFVVILLAGTGVRASVLLQSQLMDRPGEPLTVGDSAPAVGLTVKQIAALSRDMTTFAQDARDPTGGHG